MTQSRVPASGNDSGTVDVTAHLKRARRDRRAAGRGFGFTDTELAQAFRVNRWRSLRVASVQRMIIAVIMIAAGVVDADNSRWSHEGALIGAYTLIALVVLIRVYSPGSGSLVGERMLYALAMVDVVAVVSYKLLSPGEYVPLLLMLLVPRMVALDLSGPRAVLGLTFAFAAFSASILGDPFITEGLGWPQTIFFVVIYGFICGTALFAVLFRRSHIAALARITASRDALLAETMTASETERREISEAIHDGPLQDVLAARRDIADFVKKTPAEPLHRAVACLDDASRKLRDATFELHPAVLEQVGLCAAVEKLAVFTADRAGIAVATDLDHPRRTALDPMVFGVIRELLSNVVRHAEATQASVVLKYSTDAVHLDVVDDGVGMAGDIVMRRLAEGHIGLASHRARVEAAGGRLKMVDVATGTHMCMELPLPQ